MKKSISNIVSFIALGLTFILLIGANGRNYISIAQTVINKIQGNSDIQAKNTMETILRDSFTYRSNFIDAYGLSKRALGERIIGNYEFVKDESGIMQLIQGGPSSYDNYMASLKELSETLNETNIPFVYINLPDRGENFSASDTMFYYEKKYDDVMTQIQSMDIDVLDTREKLVETSLVPYDEFFFHTDVHMSSYTEFAISKLITEHLTEKYSIKFPNTGEAYDYNMYDWKNYDFCGNLCNSSGRLYNGTDIFQTFEPKFDTHLKLTIPTANTIREGDFYDVMTNRYDTIDGNPYWITNYGQYPQPYYFYDNILLPDAPKLLVICDSMFMRTNTFLALNASHITVVDPRTNDGVDHVTACLNTMDFDAVIIGDSGFMNNAVFGRKFNIPETVVPLQQISYGGMWIDYVNNNDLNGVSSVQGKISKSYCQGDTINIIGWAADFNVNKPLSKLYLKIGKRTLECSYGIERTSVSDYFQNEDLKMTGFSVTFPKGFLDNVDRIEFIQVGNDGTYRFETVTYLLSE